MLLTAKSRNKNRPARPSECLVVVRKGENEFSVARYVNSQLYDIHTVLQHEDGRWTSDDIGFLSHANEKASRRINAVKNFLRTNNRVYKLDRK